MTRMHRKAPDARRTRRNRYVAAIKPLKEMFHCTAAEASGHVFTLIRKQQSAETRIVDLDKVLAITEAELNTAKQMNDFMDAKIKALTLENEKLAKELAKTSEQ